MGNNAKVRTLADLIQYGATSEYSFPKVIGLQKVGDLVIPNNIVYDSYRDMIFENSEEVELTIEQEKKYRYRPDALSMDMYGTPNLSHMILYLNGRSEIDFKPERKVRIFQHDALLDVLKLILTHESVRMTNAKKKALG